MRQLWIAFCFNLRSQPCLDKVSWVRWFALGNSAAGPVALRKMFGARLNWNELMLNCVPDRWRNGNSESSLGFHNITKTSVH